MSLYDTLSGTAVLHASPFQRTGLFGAVPFHEREVLIYSLLIQGQHKTKVQYVITGGQRGGQKTHTISSFLGYSETCDSTVTFDTDTYAPLFSKKVVNVGDGKIEASVTYSHHQAVIHLLLPQEERFSLDFKETVYDNEQIIHVLRALDFGRRCEASFRYVYPFARHIQSAFVRVTGIEEVLAKSGEVVCYTVELIVPGQRILLWYAKDHPHHMIKYESDDQDIVLEFVKSRFLASPEGKLPE